MMDSNLLGSRLQGVKVMEGLHPETADQLKAQPFAAGSRPVDWQHANRAWRNLDAGAEQGLPHAYRTSKSSSYGQPGQARAQGPPQHPAQPAAYLPNAAPFSTAFSNADAAADKQEKRKFCQDAEHKKAGSMSGSSLLFSTSSSSHASHTFLRRKAPTMSKPKPACQSHPAAVPSANAGMHFNDGSASPSTRSSSPPKKPLVSDSASLDESMDGMHNHHGQKRSASAASLGNRANGHAHHVATDNDDSRPGGTQQDSLNPSLGSFSAAPLPEKAASQAGSSSFPAAPAQPQAQDFRWPQAPTFCPPKQGSQAAAFPFPASAASALDPTGPVNVQCQASMPSLSEAASTGQQTDGMTRAGWSSGIGKSADAAFMAPAANDNAWPQHKEDTAAGNGVGDHQPGFKKTPGQTPFVFGSAGLAQVQPQATSPAARTPLPAANRRATLRRAPIKASPAVTPFTAYATPAAQAQTPLGGSPMDWSPMDVSPGPLAGVEEASRQRSWAAADQEPTPAFKPSRPLWEAADEVVQESADHLVVEPAVAGMQLPSKAGLSRFAPTASTADRTPAQTQNFKFQGQPQTHAQSRQAPPNPPPFSLGGNLGAPQESRKVHAGSEAVAASLAASAAAAIATAAAQQEIHIEGTAATLEKLVPGAVNAACSGQAKTAVRPTATAATPSATGAFDHQRNLKPKAADAGPPAKQASPTKTPDLETAFRQSLHVGPQPPQKASEPLQQAGELNFKPRTQGAKSQEDIARVTAELNKLRFPKPAAAQISQADGLEKTFEASLQFLSKSDPLPFQPGSAEPTKRNASHDSAGPGLCSGIAPRPAPIDLSSNAAQSDLPPAAKAEPSERSDQVKLDKGSLKGAATAMAKPPPCPFVFGSKSAIPVAEPPPQDAIPAQKWFQGTRTAVPSPDGRRSSQHAQPEAGPQPDCPAAPAMGLSGDKSPVSHSVNTPEGTHAEGSGPAAHPTTAPQHGAAEATASMPSPARFVFGSTSQAESEVKLSSDPVKPAEPEQANMDFTNPGGPPADKPSAAAAASARESEPSAFTSKFPFAGIPGAASQPFFSAKEPTFAASRPQGDAPPGAQSTRFVAGFPAGLTSPKKTPGRGRQRAAGRTAHMRKGKHTPAKAQAAAQGCVGGAVSSAQGATNTDLPSTAAAGSTDNGAHKPPACFAQKAASLHPAGGTPGTADGDILQQLMRDMYSSDESWEPMHAGDRAAQNGAASRATSEPASMSTSHCSDTESSSSDEATENRAQAQPAAAAAAAHPDMPGFKAGVSFPTTQPAGAANEKQPPVFAFSQVPNKIGNLFTAGMQPGSQTKPAQKSARKPNILRKARRSPAKPTPATPLKFPTAPPPSNSAFGAKPAEAGHQPRFGIPNIPHPYVPGSFGAPKSGTAPSAMNAGIPSHLPKNSAHHSAHFSQPAKPQAPEPSSRAAAILLHHADRVQVNGIGNMDTGDHRQPDQNGAPLHPRAFISQRKQPKRRSPSRNVPPMQNGGGLHFWQVPDQANSGAIPQRHQGTGRVASGTQLNAKQDAVPGSPSELKRVDAEKDRGNAAFSSGLHAEAVRHYQMALSMLSRAGGDPVREAKLHGNLSATKLARGQPFEALDHCSIALKADATFTRGQIRAADAHSRLGNFSAAIGHLASAQDQPLAQTKLERVLHLQRRSAEAHAAAEAVSTVADGNAALKLLEAMLQPEECPWCPRLAACSCNLLLRCSQPANAVRLAERYARPSATCPDAQSWPPWVHAQAAFFAGELSKACTLMQAGQWTSQPAEGLLEQRLPSLAEVQTALSSLQRLMQLKQAGNDAVKAGKFPQAVAQYTAALVACAEAGSPAYAAVLHSNRAAALQSQSLHAEAMADCLRSRSLDPRFTKAHTRLATLLADVSLFDQAAASLEDAHASMAAGATYQETLEVQRRQREYRALTQRRRAPDHAKLMGLSTKASPDEIKKAYKKLALKFHPDKALSHCRFAAQLSPSGARLLSASEVEGRIRDSADWLFKHINEAQSKLIEAAEQKQAAAKVAAARAASYSHRGFSAYGPSWGHVESDSDNSDDGFTDAHFY
ncbi:hypothetical protein WJX74_006223 [Apatococcus lobatus]|uniref:J domain-containing protein n=1 Tax=Apatococcus lobatus TaxID=904363 RepID=A0AAW1QK56_9CHLO